MVASTLREREKRRVGERERKREREIEKNGERLVTEGHIR